MSRLPSQTPQDVNIDKIITDAISKLIRDAASDVISTGKGLLKKATNQVRLQLDRTYEPYLNNVLNRYLRAKAFLIKDEPTYLYSFYVPLELTRGKSVINAYISKVASINRCLVITGSGGSGKSMLMRHLFVDSITNGEKVPIFIELRDLNQTEKNQTEKTLLGLIKETLHSNRFTLGDDYVEKAFSAGHFAFFLDGFDEVQDLVRQNLTAQILNLAIKYDKCLVIVSSRPDDEFAGWSLFSTLTIKSLTLEKACELVSKLPYDDAKKDKFIKELAEELFEKHKSFLSNPLLLSIMLLTYGLYADIPRKLGLFYSQAYEALFQTHDAQKGGYKRERKTKLDSQDFAKVFSAFSIQTYDKREFKLSRTDAIDFLDKAKRLVNINCDSQNFLKDCLQAVCLLLQDGLLITFPHRSFQEYFTARFILETTPQAQKALIEKYSTYVGNDSVLHLIHEKNPELIERTLIIPYIEKLIETLALEKNVITKDNYYKYISLEIDCIIIGNHEGKDTPTFTFKHKKGEVSHISLVSFIVNRYQDLVKVKNFVPIKSVELCEMSRRCKKAEALQGSANPNTNQIIIRISDLIPDDEIIRCFSEGTHALSLSALKFILELKDILTGQHKETGQSLGDILGIIGL